MNKIIICFLIILSVAINSCKTDFEVNADWKDITLVYGLLNQSDSIQYIKVNKAFLGNTSAYSIATISDSVNYENAQVFVDGYKNGELKQTIPFQKTSEINKLPGIFATDKNYLYKSNTPLIQDYTYKLRISIGSKQIKSETNLIQDLYIDRPTSAQSSASFDNFISPFRVEWKSAKNGKVFELTLRLNYFEKNNLTGVSTSHYIDWTQPSKTASTADGGETMKLEVNCEGFFQYISSQLQPLQGNFSRIVKKQALDFIFSVGSTDLNTYIEVSRPSDGLVQDKPAFTNIENGIGIFSCRYKKVKSLPLSDGTIDMLSKGTHTKTLGFLDYEHSQASGLWGAK